MNKVNFNRYEYENAFIQYVPYPLTPLICIRHEYMKYGKLKIDVKVLNTDAESTTLKIDQRA